MEFPWLCVYRYMCSTLILPLQLCVELLVEQCRWCRETAQGREECCGGLNDLVSLQPLHPPILINEMHDERANSPAITQEVLVSKKGNKVIIAYSRLFFAFSFSCISAFFSLPPPYVFVLLSWLISTHIYASSSTEVGGWDLLFKTFFSSDFQEEKKHRTLSSLYPSWE